MAIETGKNLLAARLRAGLSQGDAAARAGLTQSTLSRMEKTGRVRGDSLKTLADVYGCDVGALLESEAADGILPDLLLHLRRVGSEGQKRLLRALREGLVNPKSARVSSWGFRAAAIA